MRRMRERIVSLFVRVPAVVVVATFVGLALLLMVRAAMASGAGYALIPRIFYWSVATSVLALSVTLPISLSIAIFLSEYAAKIVRSGGGAVLEFLAAIPSVMFGLWGILLFRAPTGATETSIQRVALVLGFMLVPVCAHAGYDVLRSVPENLRDGARALGATRWDAFRGVVFPYARRALAGVALVGLSRALGEGIVVVMLIGSMSGRGTLASVLITRASGAPGVDWLNVAAAAALLLLVTMALRAAGRALLRVAMRTAS